MAQKTLERFIANSEANEFKARKVRNKNYDGILAMANLQLASIYEIGGDDSYYNIYIDKAVTYFDRDPYIAVDPRYLKDKRATILIDFLEKMENYKKPKWKEGLKTGIEKRINSSNK